MPPTGNRHNALSFAKRSIAICQKAIYNFHESHHPHQPVIDIYTPAWQCRLTAWGTWYAQCHSRRSQSIVRGSSHTTSAFTPLRLEDVDIRALFFTHPVLAFALWRVLQAFHALDAAVCQRSSTSPSHSAMEDENICPDDGDNAVRPLEYLTSTDVKRAWKIALKMLNDDVRSGRLVRSELERRLWGMYVGVEGVEERVKGLVGDFAMCGLFIGEEGGQTGGLLEIVQRALDERCLMIDEILRVGDRKEVDEKTWEGEVAASLMVMA